MWTEFVFFWFFLSLTLWSIGLHTAMVEFLFFAMGATLTFVGSFFLPSDQVLFLWLEIFFFFSCSSFFFFFFYQKIKNSLRKATIPPLSHVLQGKVGVCIEAIQPHHDGSIFCNGSYWKGRASENIQQDDQVQVIKQEGLILIVKKLS